jgi:hypothetical protein
MTTLENYIENLNRKIENAKYNSNSAYCMMNFFAKYERKITKFTKLLEIFTNVAKKYKNSNKTTIESVVFDDMIGILGYCYGMGLVVHGCNENCKESEVDEWVSSVDELYMKFISYFKKYEKLSNEENKTESSFLCFGTSLVKNYIPSLEYYERVSQSFSDFKSDRKILYDKGLKIIDKFADFFGIEHQNVVYSDSEIYNKVKSQLASEIDALVGSRSYSQIELLDRINKMKVQI